MIHDRPTRRVSFARIVPGLNARIPWPENAPVEHEEYEADTKRIDLEDRTYVPTLLRPPMPEVVLDELRNRYSKFRTRHTPEYIAKKEAEEAEKQARKQSAKTMLLPVQEYNRKLREQRRALGQPVLTEEMLAKIGEVMARNAERRAQGVNTAVDNVQKAVEQLSMEDNVTTTTTEDQPRVE
jgi:large subunit ribosomal protein L24